MVLSYYTWYMVLLAFAFTDSDGNNGPFPGFRSEPVDQVVVSANHSILCQGKGEGLTYSWWKNGKRVQPDEHRIISKEGSLILLSAKKSRDEGYYRCVVRNQFGSIISKRAHITFPYINPFKDSNANVRVNRGQKAVLHCRAPASYPDRNIHWSRRSGGHGAYRPLITDHKSHRATSRNGDLYFSYTRKGDEGVYYCSVENNWIGSVLKRAITLTVEKREEHGNIDPKVWLFENRIAIKGSNFVLECLSYGTPIPKMKFRHGDSMSELEGSEQVGNRLRHEFGNYHSKEVDSYICEAMNDFGKTDEKKAYVRMEGKPEFRVRHHDISISSDDRLQIPCSAHGTPSPTYSWYVNTVLRERKIRPRNKYHNITIAKVMKHHRGVYQCVAQNKHGESVMTVNVNVVEMAPNFRPPAESPASITHGVIGQNTEIFCRPNGAPRPSITWSKKGDPNYINKHSRRFIILPSGSLRVVNIQQTDSGIYTCYASNRLGRRSKSGELRVSGGLAITHELTKNDTYKTGDQITLRCMVSCSDDIEIYFMWKRGTREIRPRRRNSRVRIINEGKMSLLLLRNAETRDTGYYTCVVRSPKNKHKSRSKFILVSDSQLDLTRPPGTNTTVEANSEEPIEMSEKGKPSPPSHVSVSQQHKTSIKLIFTLGRDNGNTLRYVLIESINNYDNRWTLLKQKDIKKGERRHTLYEHLTLSPWANYRFRVIAVNDIGRSKPSLPTTSWTTTPPAKPEKSPINIKGVGIATDKIRITFERLKKIDENGPGIHYVIFYKGIGRSYKMVKRRISNENHVTLQFASMDSYYRLYEFQIQTRNNVGHGPKSLIHTAYTGERKPLVVPQRLNVTTKPPYSFVEATWTGVSRSRQAMRGKFLGYKFLYWIRPKPGEPRVEQYQVTHSSPITIELRPFTEYFFQVLTFNNAGDGPASDEVGPIRTPEGVPSAPLDLRISDASASEATLRWKDPEHKNGRITVFVLRYYSGDSEQYVQKDIDSNANEVRIAGLSSTSEYTFNLSAKTNAGIGDAASVVFDFKQVPSLKLSAPIVRKRTQTSIVLEWLKPNISITGYKVYYWRSDGDERIKWTNNDIITATINNLKPGRPYRFQVALYNNYGTGPKSDVIVAHTRGVQKVEALHTTHIPNVDVVKGAPMVGYATNIRTNVALMICLLLVILLIPPR